MASSDIKIQDNGSDRRRTVEMVGAGRGDAGTSEQSLLIKVMRRRWWLLGICALVSGVVGFVASESFKTIKATSGASIIYRPLPDPPGHKVYQAPSLQTLVKQAKSTASMQKLIDKHNLNVPEYAMIDYFKFTATRDSSIVDIQLTWADAEDGVEMLNDLMDMIIEHVYENRKSSLDSYIKIAEEELLENEKIVVTARSKLRKYNAIRNEKLQKASLQNGEYARILGAIEEAEKNIELAELARQGLADQSKQIKAISMTYIEDAKKSMLENKTRRYEAVLEKAKKKFRIGSAKIKEIEAIGAEIAAFPKLPENTDRTYIEWKTALARIGEEILGGAEIIQSGELSRIEKSYENSLTKLQDIEIKKLPAAKMIQLRNKWLGSLREKETTLAGKISNTSPEDGDVHQQQLDKFEAEYRSVESQLSNLKKLRSNPMRELSVQTPASELTTVIKSDRKQIFVLCFVGCFLLLSAPVFVAETFLSREIPVVQASKRYGMPILSQGSIRTMSSKGSDRDAAKKGRDESLRLLALRIQQSIRGQGSVVLFSGLDHDDSPVPLLAELAECFSEREERVLIVDAAPPTGLEDDSDAEPATSSVAVVGNSKINGATIGLTDFLSSECDDVSELIRPTDCSNVDYLTYGTQPFPKEGMASRSLTELINACRKRYTLTLVASPSTNHRADLLMLSARADGIVFTVTRESNRGQFGQEVLRDLRELDAPVIGLIG